MATMTEIVDLPIDLYRLIVLNLDPKDWVHCLNVSTVWRTTFSHPSLVWEFLNLHFPQAREVRKLRERAEGDLIFDDHGKKPVSAHSLSRPCDIHPRETSIVGQQNLASILYTLTKRYHHLRSGAPFETSQFALAASKTAPQWCRHFPVAPWDRRLQYKNHNIPFHYPDTLWAYDDGLLAFPSADLGTYIVFDLAWRACSPIAIFEPGVGKIVRRLSFKDRLLLVEWALADQPQDWCPHQHYATFFDVLPGSAAGEWTVQFRNELSIDAGGLPLNSRARFFSTHSCTHYAVYIWHLLTIRAANGRVLKDESLRIYDISAPCKFRPSQHPPARTGSVIFNERDGSGPPVVGTWDKARLESCQIAQGDHPTLTELRMDAGSLYVVQERHRWLAGTQADDRYLHSHRVQTVSIPLGAGPYFVHGCDGQPDGRASFCRGASAPRELRKAPCWRHGRFPEHVVAEAVDEGAGVRVYAAWMWTMEQSGGLELARLVACVPRAGAVARTGAAGESEEKAFEKMRPVEVEMEQGLFTRLAGRGKICGDERWLVGDDGAGNVVVCRFD